MNKVLMYLSIHLSTHLYLTVHHPSQSLIYLLINLAVIHLSLCLHLSISLYLAIYEFLQLYPSLYLHFFMQLVISSSLSLS